MRMMLVLAECRSMTTTAKKLHVSQPALTYQLKVIESELGFKVFNRTRTGTSLTAEGSFLHETIKDLVANYDETVRLARAMAKGTAAGMVRVGVNDFSRDTISFFLNVAQSNVSFTFIHCGSVDPVKLLREGVIDLWSASDGAMVGAPASLRFVELSTAGQSAFVSKDHRLASHETLEIKDLANETVWLWPRGHASVAANAIRDELESLGADLADFIPGVPAIVTASMDQGVVVYDDGYLPPSSQTAVQIPISDAQTDTLGLVYLASQERRLKPTLDDLVDHIWNNQDRTISPSELAAERIVSVLEEISSTVKRGGMKDIVPLVEYGLELGISAHHLLNRGLLAGMGVSGDAYQKGEIFTTEMMAAVATTNLAMDVLQPHFAIEDEKPITGTAVIGTVLGDRHDIGKNLVRIMLESRDIEVADLGNGVAPEAFVEHVRNNPNCNLVLISVNYTDYLGNARAVVSALQEAKLREQVFIMVGGSAASPEFAEEIGADAFTYNAEDPAAKAYEFMSL